MRWLFVAILWLVAIVLALIIVRRVRRGKPVVLAGRWSPRVIRMVAVMLVMFGAGEAEPTTAQAAPVQPPTTDTHDKLPANVSVSVVQTWLYHQAAGSPMSAVKLALVKVLASDKPTVEEIAAVRTHIRFLPKTLQQLINADLDAKNQGKPSPGITLENLTATLKEIETYSYYDHWWNAYLWRKATALDVAQEQEWTTAFAAMRQHARITDLLLRTQATIKPIMVSQRAWMSKAGPGPEVRKQMAAESAAISDMFKLMGEQFATTDEGSWKRDGVAMVKADKDSPAPVLIRAGQKKDFSSEFATRIGRLDLLKTGDNDSILWHDGLGRITLPARTLVNAQTLPKYLSDEAKRKLEQLVQEALTKNSEEAADRLETMLPFAHDAIRMGLKELPRAKGAPRLRLILSLYDDVIMPALKPASEPSTPLGIGGGLGGPGRGRGRE